MTTSEKIDGEWVARRGGKGKEREIGWQRDRERDRGTEESDNR